VARLLNQTHKSPKKTAFQLEKISYCSHGGCDDGGIPDQAIQAPEIEMGGILDDTPREAEALRQLQLVQIVWGLPCSHGGR
jgi:hypothetical protein